MRKLMTAAIAAVAMLGLSAPAMADMMHEDMGSFYNPKAELLEAEAAHNLAGQNAEREQIVRNGGYKPQYTINHIYDGADMRSTYNGPVSNNTNYAIGSVSETNVDNSVNGDNNDVVVDAHANATSEDNNVEANGSFTTEGDATQTLDGNQYQ